MGRPKIEPRTPDLKGAYVGTKEAAAMLGVSVSSVQKLVSAGKLEAWRTDGGHRRISLASIRTVDMGPPVSEASPAPASGALSVLIVEDNATTSRAYTRILGQFGGAVEAAYAKNGAEALLMVAKSPPDLLIADLMMEPFDGFYLVRTIRGLPELTNLRILIITGMSDKDIERRGGLDQDVLMWRKPLPAERLQGYLEGILHSRRLRV